LFENILEIVRAFPTNVGGRTLREDRERRRDAFQVARLRRG
jgi:hypothetical protein